MMLSENHITSSIYHSTYLNFFIIEQKDKHNIVAFKLQFRIIQKNSKF